MSIITLNLGPVYSPSSKYVYLASSCYDLESAIGRTMVIS
jgi:hypothetical protein